MTLNQAWLVMAASFLVNGIVFGILNCYGILFVKVEIKSMKLKGIVR